jgi:hypothetical protein
MNGDQNDEASIIAAADSDRDSFSRSIYNISWLPSDTVQTVNDYPHLSFTFQDRSHSFGITYSDLLNDDDNNQISDNPYVRSIMVLPLTVCFIALGLMVLYLIAMFFRSVSGETLKWCYKVSLSITAR